MISPPVLVRNNSINLQLVYKDELTLGIKNIIQSYFRRVRTIKYNNIWLTTKVIMYSIHYTICFCRVFRFKWEFYLHAYFDRTKLYDVIWIDYDTFLSFSIQRIRVVADSWVLLKMTIYTRILRIENWKLKTTKSTD